MTRSQNFILPGSTVLVTGGALRLGRAICLEFAQHQANIAIHYNSSAIEAQALVKEIEAMGVKACALQADLNRPEQCDDLLRRAEAALGPVRILVNSASQFQACQLAEVDEIRLTEMMNLHALSPLKLGLALVACLPQNAQGRIINLLDAYSPALQMKHVAYNLSKQALTTLTQMMALEFAPNVTVNAVSPGVILPAPGESEESLLPLLRRVPLERVGTVEEIAQAVVFLAQAGYITGQTLTVDGGANLSLRRFI